MTPDELRAHKELPHGLGAPLLGLWHLAKGDWHKAHETVQDEETPEAAWVHAHLHRVEGDESNAGYWYRRAGRPHAKNSHDEEWNIIAAALLARGP
jgi:hypothetical protein